jgi:transcription elongation factor Elf1
MRELSEERALHCPYCGESITVLVDWSAGAQHYVEDCEVCCRPIEFSVEPSGDGGGSLRARRGDD